jgi:hypothetical protein
MDKLVSEQVSQSVGAPGKEIRLVHSLPERPVNQQDDHGDDGTPSQHISKRSIGLRD